MLDAVLAGQHNTFIAGAAGSENFFLLKQISERTKEAVISVTSTSGYVL